MRQMTVSRVRLGRRLMLASIYGVVALGLGVMLGAAPARPAGAPATAGVNKAGADAQFEKAKALYDDGKYAEAQVENDKALAMDPGNTSALLLKRVLGTKVTATGEPAATMATSTGPAGRMALLNTQQISLIRLMELGPDDRRITGTVDRKTLDDLWDYLTAKDPTIDKSRATHDAFVAPANFPAQVRKIRESNDSKFMEKVLLTNDPAVLLTYRNTINTFVLQNCATSECHGGAKGGALRLVSPGTAAEQQYTNFYILTQYTNAEGRMIDRDNPDQSLLVQYALPWANAAFKHPKAEVKKLTGPQDNRMRVITDWVKSLAFPKPNYQITFELPRASRPAMAPVAASAPATAAATAASKPAGK